jgi:hypothetical protein
MLDPPPEEPEDDASMTFADLVEETAKDVSSFLEAILMIEPPKRHSTPLRAAGSYQGMYRAG